jgi:NAD(P)-dependent dehydrogenase (short-subunit alcohol dehydrogenase family)
MIKGIQGRVALVTGGASGIGKVTAQMFAREGAKVMVTTDANIQGAEETVKLIKDDGGEAVFVKCDVSKAKEVEAPVDKTVEIFGSLDFAFNNAGIGPDGKRVPVVNIVDMDEELWNRHMAINLTGVFPCMKYEMRRMMKQKRGSIVNTSSVGAFKAVPGFAAYDATKTGLFGLMKAAALEGAEVGIRVNTICPGPTQRTLLMDFMTASQPEMKEKFKEIVPMGRVANPEEMAEAVIWFCSDAASFVTGQILSVDGGMTAM